MFKRSILVVAAVCSLASVGMAVAGDAPVSANANPTDIKQLRKEAAHRPRRIIMNNDGNDARTPPEEPRTYENFLSKRTSPLAGSQVDAIFYCSGVFNLYHHHSQETECRKHGDQKVVDWAWELGKDGGPDSLQTIVDFGHKNKMEVFWSMRMNDTHDSGDDSLLCQWKRAHPEYLMGTIEDRKSLVAGGKRWSAVNYELPEVREKVFRIFRDVATRYDVDGLELDFFRHSIYFKPQMLGQPVTQEQRDLMTNLLSRVRKMADEVAAKRGRPMLVSVRVPDSVEFCSAIGLDLVRWMKDDLIDTMAVSCYFQLNPWKTSVELGHAYNVPVYPCLSEPRYRKSPESQKIRSTRECYRGRALDAWNAGADGVYLFNYFNPRASIWHELGDPKTLASLDQIYPAGTVSANDIRAWLADGRKWLNQPAPLPDEPVKLGPGKKASVKIPVAAAVTSNPGQTAKVKVRILYDDAAKGMAAVAQLNGRPLAKGMVSEKWVDYAASPADVRQGVNVVDLALRADAAATTVGDAVIEIRHAPASP